MSWLLQVALASVSPSCGLSRTLHDGADLAQRLDMPLEALSLYRKSRTSCAGTADTLYAERWKDLNRTELLALAQTYWDDDAWFLADAASRLADERLGGKVVETLLRTRLDVLGTSVQVRRVRWVERWGLRAYDPIVYAFFDIHDAETLASIESLNEGLPEDLGLIALTSGLSTTIRPIGMPVGVVGRDTARAHGLRASSGAVFIRGGIIEWIGSVSQLEHASRTGSRPF